tara:strand:+ start:78 stop:389 length:312 start_codon:yes stop_codon:yes gene_type:complete
MSEEKVFIDGMIVKRNERAPDFVLCNLSVKVAELIPFLQKHESNGWVNIQCKVSKGGKHYAELDTWQPTQGDHAKAGMENARQAAEPQASAAPQGFDSDDIPF